MLAIEPLACCKRFFFNSGVACRLSSGPLAEDRGKVLAIEAIKAPKGLKKNNRWTTDI